MMGLLAKKHDMMDLLYTKAIVSFNVSPTMSENQAARQVTEGRVKVQEKGMGPSSYPCSGMGCGLLSKESVGSQEYAIYLLNSP